MKILATFLLIFLINVNGKKTLHYLDNINCETLDGVDTSYYCQRWKQRLRDVNIDGIKCENKVQDDYGNSLMSCTPKWITICSGCDKKIIATYKKNGDQLNVIIEYEKFTPEEKFMYISILSFITIFIILSCIYDEPKREDTVFNSNDSSFTNGLIIGSFASTTTCDEFGGTDYFKYD